MDNREWLDDYTALKQINANDPFTVPAGYFDELAQHIASRVRLEELKNSSTGFTVPENYFEQLSSNIQSRINIEQIANNQNTGFTVPENYFEELGSNIQARIAVEDVLNKQDSGFAVPPNYFDELSNNIQSRINIEEYVNNKAQDFTVPENYFEELSSNIQSRINVEEHISVEVESFTVPENYVEKLNASILAKTVNEVEVEETDNVINFQDAVKKRATVRKLLASHTIRYATAACFALILGITVVLRSSVPAHDHNHSFLHEQVSSVPVDEIRSYLELHSDASDTRTLMDANQKSNSSNTDEDLSDYIDAN